jgi:hypothetical protein
MLDASSQHHLVKDLSTSLANKPECVVRISSQYTKSVGQAWGGTYDSSISGAEETRGCTWLLSLASPALKADAGVALADLQKRIVRTNWPVYR